MDATLDKLLKDMEPSPAVEQLRSRLEKIQELINERQTIDMKLGFDVLGGYPALQVGIARLNQSGDGYLKPEKIEIFTGQLTIGIVLDFICGQISD